MASFPLRGSRGSWVDGLLRRRRKGRRRAGSVASQPPEQLEPRQMMAADAYDSASMDGYGYDAGSSWA
jgi:hypothetical protein